MSQWPPNDPYDQQPYGQPPYGARPPGPSQAGTANKILGYVLGIALIGPALAVACPLAGIGIADSSGAQGNGIGAIVIAGIVIPFLLPIPLIFFKPTRPWGVGILIGVALTIIVLGGLCAGFIYLLSQENMG